MNVIKLIVDGTYAVNGADELVSLDLKAGYVASRSGGYIVPLDAPVIEHLSAIERITADCKSARMVIASPCYVGRWTSDGRAYYDVSVVFADVERALAFGKLNAQEAIWDCAVGGAIPVPLGNKF